MGASSRGKIGFAGGELLDRAVGKTEVEVACIVEGFGDATDFGCASSESEGTAELEAGVSPVLHRFGDGLEEAVGERVQKCGEHLGSGDELARSLKKRDGGFFYGGRKVGRLLMEIQSEAEKGEGVLIFSGDGFNEKAGEFSILQKKIVGPFEGGLELGQGADSIGGGKGTQ